MSATSVPFSAGSRKARKRGDQDMATHKEFAAQLHILIEQFNSDGVDPIDLANELQDQVNVFIGQHNLEYELCSPARA